MLKIGSVRWKGRCGRHSTYNPELDGPGAIKGGCRRCQMLYDIWDAHSKMVRLINEFGHREDGPAAPGKNGASEDEGRQMSLLAGVDSQH
jgi:hypothetical protein